MADVSEIKQTDDLEQMVTFNLGQEEFGVNILQVQEINRMVEITQVPQTEDYVEGIINLRGKVIPIINLRKKFGMADRENDNQTRIVVVDSGGEIVGMVVDGVSEVLRVQSESLENAPGMISGGQGSKVGAEYIQAIVKLEKRLLIYLNLENIIGTSKFPVV
jgi:purine-binding chemotaxis protein CheW